MAKIKKSYPAPEPDFIQKHKASLRRSYRQVIYLNDGEMSVVKEYCARFGVKSRSAVFRQATMERLLDELDNSHTTLF